MEQSPKMFAAGNPNPLSISRKSLKLVSSITLIAFTVWMKKAYAKEKFDFWLLTDENGSSPEQLTI